jgi:hypothetical protein
MTPRHPPRALRSLTTPIGPPRPPSVPAQKKAGTSRNSRQPIDGLCFPRRPDKPSLRLPTRRRVPNLPFVVFRKGSLTRPRATPAGRSRFQRTDTVVEIATHPILRAIKGNRLKFPFTSRGCVLLVRLTTELSKNTDPTHTTPPARRAVMSHRIVPDFGWPGGEAVRETAPPRGQRRTVNCIRDQNMADHPCRYAGARPCQAGKPDLRVGRPVGQAFLPDSPIILAQRETSGSRLITRCFRINTIRESVGPSFSIIKLVLGLQVARNRRITIRDLCVLHIVCHEPSGEAGGLAVNPEQAGQCRCGLIDTEGSGSFPIAIPGFRDRGPEGLRPSFLRKSLERR